LAGRALGAATLLTFTKSPDGVRRYPFHRFHPRLPQRLAAAQTGVDALDGVDLDRSPGTLASVPPELNGSAGRLDLVPGRLGAAGEPFSWVDPLP
jgi:hypothetical protein